MKEFEKYIKYEQINFKYARGASYLWGKEFHLSHEIVLFLDGEAEFTAENIKYRLIPNTFIIIPKENYHLFSFTGDISSYYRCVLNFNDIPEYAELIKETMNEVKIIPDASGLLSHFKRLSKTSEGNLPEYKKQIILKAVLGEFLVDLSAIGENKKLKNRQEFNIVTQKAIEYINAEFQNKITVQSIADALNISSSSLSHIFKSDMHISVYKYILNKRLITAHKLMSESVPAMRAASLCGFNDYSGFYRAYKKFFDISPDGSR